MMKKVHFHTSRKARAMTVENKKLFLSVSESDLKRLDDSDKKWIDVSSKDAAYTITHFLEGLA